MQINQTVTVYSPAKLAKGAEAPSFKIGQENHQVRLDGAVEPALLSRLSHPQDCFTSLSQVEELLKDGDSRLSQARQSLENGSTRIQIDVGKDSPWTARLAESGALELRSPVHPAKVTGEQSVRIYKDQVTVCTHPRMAETSTTQELQAQWNAAQGTLTCSQVEVDFTQEIQRLGGSTRFTPLFVHQAELDAPASSVGTGLLHSIQGEFAPHSILQGIDDDRLQPFLQGKTGVTLSGWQPIGELDDHAELFAENFLNQGQNGSFQALSIYPHDGSLKLVTSHQIDSRNSNVVVVARDADGQASRRTSHRYD